MVMYRKAFDPGETSRRLNLVIRLPETLAGLAEVPYRQETPLIDHILQQWFIDQAGGRPIEEAIADGTLQSSIQQAIHQAKKGRADATSGVNTPALPPSTAAAPIYPKASTGPVSEAHHEPTVTETVTQPVTQTETQQVTETVTQPVTVSVTGNAAEPSSATDKQESMAQATATTPTSFAKVETQEGDNDPPPPSGVADRLGRMFDID